MKTEIATVRPATERRTLTRVGGDRDVLHSRTKAFALRVIRLVEALRQNNVGWVLGQQLLKSGTSNAANGREAQRASSNRHFVTMMEVA